MRRLLPQPARLRSESGYTLVELLIVMVLMAIVLGALTTLWVSGSNAELRLNRQFQAQQTGRLALDRIRTDIHCANAAQAQTIGTYPGVKVAFPSGGCFASTISWCVVPSTAMTGRYALWRTTSTSNICTASDASRLLVADYLTTSSGVFSTPALVNNGLETVSLDFKISTNPNANADIYELKDSIVVGNSTRCPSSGSCSTITVP